MQFLLVKIRDEELSSAAWRYIQAFDNNYDTALSALKQVAAGELVSLSITQKNEIVSREQGMVVFAASNGNENECSIFVVVGVGHGCTVSIGSDSYPYTVVGIENERTITIQEDDYRVVHGTFRGNDAEIVYTRNPFGGKRTFTLRKNGRWILKGCDKTPFLSFYGRAYYQDPHF